MNTLERILTRAREMYETDADFERAVGLPPKTTDKWENRGSKSYRNYMPQLASALKTTVAYLMCETDDPTPVKKDTSNDVSKLSQEDLELLRIFHKLSDKGRDRVLSNALFEAHREEQPE